MQAVVQPSVYALPGYFQVTVLAFWLPTLMFVLMTIYVYRRDARLRGTWVEKGAWAVIAVSASMQIAGWIFDRLWLHTLSLDVGLAGAIACSIWAFAIRVLGRAKSDSEKQ